MTRPNIIQNHKIEIVKALREARQTGRRPAAPDADLRGANLWGGMPVQAGRSGTGYLVPTPDGWRITIGCWRDKTLDDLRDLIEDRTEWPDAKGEERERRRPILAAVLALCKAHIGQQPDDIIDRLAEKWGRSNG